MSEQKEKPWNWTDAREEGIVAFPSVDAVAVYRNGDGDVVIRQQSRMGEDDSFVVIPDSHIADLVMCLQNQMKD